MLAISPFPRFTTLMTRRLVLFLAILATAMWCPGAGKKTKMTLVTFHLEGEETANPKFMTPVKLGKEHRQYFFNKIAIFTDKDIEWFYPFTSRDGASFGAAFKLKDHSATELKAITLTAQGKIIGIRCSDAQLSAVLIDRPVSDGVIVMWEGLQQRHLEEFRTKFPHVDDLAADSGPDFALPGR